MYKVVISTALALGVALPAHAFQAENRVTVNAVSNGFNVTGDAGYGARDIWCAAADYARSEAGARDAQRLYVAQARAARGREVVFTLNPEGLTPTSVLILGQSVKTAGANLSVGHAYSFCADHRLSDGPDR